MEPFASVKGPNVIITDYGTIPIPKDMLGLLRGKARKNGMPDRRFKAAKLFRERFREESEKLKAAYAGR